jgi:hypothetical protein
MIKLWYQAEIRWAVMEEGQGLREWKDSVYIFMSDNSDAAFQSALEIGYRECDVHEEDGNWVETRLAEVASLHCMGASPTEFEVPLRPLGATEQLPFEHVFDPEGTMPLEPF